jgi:tRNA1(Val) A37 N6-methylase TrmN6
VATETTEDGFLGGRLVLSQPKRGYRAGLDAVLLAAAVPAGAGRALDLGCGVGAVMLAGAVRAPGWRFVGLEADVEAVSLAGQNISRNGLGHRVSVESGDALDLPTDWQNRFDLVMSNPPFFAPGEISAPGEGREAAWLNRGGLKAWLNAMFFACKPKGRVTLIHRAHELARILAVLDRQAGEITVLPLHPRAGEPASRVLVTCRKGLRPGPLSLLPGRVLHGGEGATDWLDAVSRGDGCAFHE